jgi:uncharacterized RDD family membrane protein YckC
MTDWERSKPPWVLAFGIWLVYGTAALTEGLMVFHPHSPLTSAVFGSFANSVDAAYRGDPFGDNLHKAFAVVDTFFAPVFWAAAVGLLRKQRWGLLLAFGCALTSLALLTTDVLVDAFGGFRNVLDPWTYGLAFVPYYVVVGCVMRYTLRHWQAALPQGSVDKSAKSASTSSARTVDDANSKNSSVHPPAFSRRALAFLLDGAIALVLFAIGHWAELLAAAYLLFRDGLGGGQSVGKRALSLRVIEREAGVGIGLVGSLKRNIVFAIPLLNVGISASVFESVLLYFDEDGLRLGDRIAGTRVVRT